MAVVGADLPVEVAGGSRGLPLLTVANGTLMARRPGYWLLLSMLRLPQCWAIGQGSFSVTGQ
jgi:hypothetical protein